MILRRRKKSDTVQGAEGKSESFLDAMMLLGIAGILSILCYSLRFWASGQSLRIFGVGMLIAGAALTCGLLLGFIFAIPRMGGKKVDAATSDANVPKAKDADEMPAVVPIRPNDNLAEISDWMTKIIVGVGLVELHSLPAKLGTVSYYLAPGLQPASCGAGIPCSDPTISGQTAGMAILIFYFSLGFLLGCIWTMVFFMQDLTRPYRKVIDSQEQYIEITTPILSAEAAITKNQLDVAMSTIQESLKNSPRDGRALMTKARILKRQAMQSGQSGAQREELLKQAVSLADEAIALMPGEGEPIYNKACYQALLDRVGLKDKVLANLESAFQLNPALRISATEDSDLASMQQDTDFLRLTRGDQSPEA